MLCEGRRALPLLADRCWNLTSFRGRAMARSGDAGWAAGLRVERSGAGGEARGKQRRGNAVGWVQVCGRRGGEGGEGGGRQVVKMDGRGRGRGRHLRAGLATRLRRAARRNTSPGERPRPPGMDDFDDFGFSDHDLDDLPANTLLHLESEARRATQPPVVDVEQAAAVQLLQRIQQARPPPAPAAMLPANSGTARARRRRPQGPAADQGGRGRHPPPPPRCRPPPV